MGEALRPRMCAPASSAVTHDRWVFGSTCCVHVASSASPASPPLRRLSSSEPEPLRSPPRTSSFRSAASSSDDLSNNTACEHHKTHRMGYRRGSLCNQTRCTCKSVRSRRNNRLARASSSLCINTDHSSKCKRPWGVADVGVSLVDGAEMSTPATKHRTGNHA